MKALLWIFGGMLLLVALFAGGCSLLFTIAAIAATLGIGDINVADSSHMGYSLLPITVAGYVVAAFAGIIGLSALRASK